MNYQEICSIAHNREQEGRFQNLTRMFFPGRKPVNYGAGCLRCWKYFPEMYMMCDSLLKTYTQSVYQVG